MSAAMARRYFLRGRERLLAGDREAAMREMSAALELSPSFVEARVGLSLAVCEQDPPRAAQLLRTGLSRRPCPSEARRMWLALGDVLVRGGDFLGAESAYGEAARRLEGEAARELDGRRVRLAAKTGRYAESLAILERSAHARKP